MWCGVQCVVLIVVWGGRTPQKGQKLQPASPVAFLGSPQSSRGATQLVLLCHRLVSSTSRGLRFFSFLSFSSSETKDKLSNQ